MDEAILQVPLENTAAAHSGLRVFALKIQNVLYHVDDCGWNAGCKRLPKRFVLLDIAILQHAIVFRVPLPPGTSQDGKLAAKDDKKACGVSQT